MYRVVSCLLALLLVCVSVPTAFGETSYINWCQAPVIIFLAGFAQALPPISLSGY